MCNRKSWQGHYGLLQNSVPLVYNGPQFLGLQKWVIKLVLLALERLDVSNPVAQIPLQMPLAFLVR